MLPKRLVAVISLCLFYIQQNTGLPSEPLPSEPSSTKSSSNSRTDCKHYVTLDDTPYPLDICTSQSIRGVITSTKTICDPESETLSVMHQHFSGPSCSDGNFRYEEAIDKDISEVVCEGNACGLSFRTYSNDDCDSDFTDFAYLRGVVYSEQSQCTIYDCAVDESDDQEMIMISTVDCDTDDSYITSVYKAHSMNCQVSPMYCGVSSTPPTLGGGGNVILLPDAMDPDTTTTTTEIPVRGEGLEIEELLPEGDIEIVYTIETYAPINATTAKMEVSNKNDNQPQYDLRIYTLPALPITSICLTIVLIILLVLIYFLYCDEDAKTQMTSTLKLFVVLSIGCNAFAIVCILSVMTVMQMNVWSANTYKMAILPYYGSCIGYVGGKFCLESFFLLRVYTSFQGSVFALSRRKCMLLFIWMSIISLMWLITFILDLESLYFGYIVIWGFECLFIITLLCVFGNGLQRLLAQTVKSSLQRITAPQRACPIPSKSIISMKNTEEISAEASVPDLSALQSIDSIPSSNLGRWRYVCCKMRDHVRSTKSSISSERLSLIHLMTRCVLLSSISLITTAVFGVLLAIQTSIEIQHLYVVYAIWCIDITINSFCLFLNFRFTNKFYKKCCTLCHSSCQNILEYISASHIVHSDTGAMKSLSNLERVRSISTQ